jgi:hypothetical protein
MSRAQQGMEPPATTPRQFFWVMFWATILILALLYLYAEFKVQGKIARLAPGVDGRVLVSEDFYREWTTALPEVFSEIQPAFDSAIGEMEQRISTHVDAAFQPVYARLPDFLDFHYSVVGEYTELAAALYDRIGSDLERILFTETGFEQHLVEAMAAISSDGESLLGDLLVQMHQKLTDRFDLDEAELGLVSSVATLTLEDAGKRFGTGEMMLKGASAAIGGGAVAAALAKTVSTKAATKLGAKVAGKTAIKAAGAGGSAAGAAAAGLLCGPAAWICAPVGGVAAAVAAWFATDKIVIEVDEYLHRESFELEIRAAIDAERDRLKGQLTALYRDRFQQVFEDNRVRFNEMTTREVIERRR